MIHSVKVTRLTASSFVALFGVADDLADSLTPQITAPSLDSKLTANFPF
jgi:hypothetical protein